MKYLVSIVCRMTIDIQKMNDTWEMLTHWKRWKLIENFHVPCTHIGTGWTKKVAANDIKLFLLAWELWQCCHLFARAHTKEGRLRDCRRTAWIHNGLASDNVSLLPTYCSPSWYSLRLKRWKNRHRSVFHWWHLYVFLRKNGTACTQCACVGLFEA